MPQPGALLPTIGKQIALGSTPFTKIPSCAAVMMTVATQGEIEYAYEQSPDDIIKLTLPSGLHVIEGSIGQMWVAGGSALVLTPVDMVTILNA